MDSQLIHDLWKSKFTQAVFAVLLAVLHPNVLAQIVPDATLPTNSLINQNGNLFTIDGGTAAGENLFHSFEEFSLPTGGEAFFNNATNITNIISRITGGKISNIDGLMRANGSANLLIINPNGIVFGPNATLNIGGSFLGSTANSIQFSNGSFFSATNPTNPPLLSVNVPIGLQYGPNPGAIVVQVPGHNLTPADPLLLFSPLQRIGDPSGLQVMPGKTLALVGGDVILSGGTLTTNSGRIELGSVKEGFVSLNPTSFGWTLDYSGVPIFGDIEMYSQALAEASGVGSGAIALRSRNLQMRDGSGLWIQNQGSQLPGKIEVNVSESMELIGTTSDGNIRSGVFTDTVGGPGADITVSARQLLISDGGNITTSTYSPAASGNLSVKVSELTQVSGVSPVNFRANGAIVTLSFGPGDTGELQLSTGRLKIEGGGTITGVTFGSGNTGNVNIQATDSIEIIGIDPNTFIPSTLGSVTLRSGNAGNLTVNTASLRIQQGGRIEASTGGTGNAGNVIINATESIEVQGTVPGSINPSSIAASVAIQNEQLQQLFQLPPIPSGESGDITINTPVIRIVDSGLVNVKNDGTGNAGTVRINADLIFLESQGSITASTASGEGGNMILNANNLLQMRGNSLVSTQADGTGNGGNLTINTDVLVALEDSDIIANAFEGAGGNIQINTQSILGTQFRETQTPASDITASSEFGVSGTVTIANPEVDLSSGLVELPENLSDPSKQVAVGCAADQGNSFTLTGRGGLPEDPTEMIRGQTIWRDLRDFSDVSNFTENSSFHSLQSLLQFPPEQIVEAKGWNVDSQGNVELVVHLPNQTIMHRPSRHPECSDL